MPLSDLNINTIPVVSANDYAAEALRLMRNHRLDQLVVLDGAVVAGVVDIRDLEKLSTRVLRERDVREYLNNTVPVIEAETSPEEAFRLMSRYGASSLVVCQKGQYLGVLAGDELAPKSQRSLVAS